MEIGQLVYNSFSIFWKSSVVTMFFRSDDDLVVQNYCSMLFFFCFQTKNLSKNKKFALVARKVKNQSQRVKTPPPMTKPNSKYPVDKSQLQIPMTNPTPLSEANTIDRYLPQYSPLGATLSVLNLSYTLFLYFVLKIVLGLY